MSGLHIILRHRIPMAAAPPLKPLGACLLCKKPVCDCMKDEPKHFISEASKLRLRRWFIEEEIDDCYYEGLCAVVSEIIDEDSRLRVGAVYDRVSNTFGVRAREIREGAQKRLREEQAKRAPSPEL